MPLSDLNTYIHPVAEQLGPSLRARLKQLISDEIPTGSHRERAVIWRQLAERCARAARLHDEAADEQQATRQYVLQFAPRFREQALKDYRSRQREARESEHHYAAELERTKDLAPA